MMILPRIGSGDLGWDLGAPTAGAIPASPSAPSAAPPLRMWRRLGFDVAAMVQILPWKMVLF